MNEITNRLQELLAANAASATPEDTEILAGENPQAATAPARTAQPAPTSRPTANPDMTPANGYSGRSPAGRLRNFRAMNDTKLTATYNQVAYEGDDNEALHALRNEMLGRGLL